MSWQQKTYVTPKRRLMLTKYVYWVLGKPPSGQFLLGEFPPIKFPLT